MLNCKKIALWLLIAMLILSCQSRQPSSSEVGTHKIYLPLIIGQKQAQTLRGVGFTGSPALLPMMDWWYTWGWRCRADQRFVPMIRGRPEMAYLREAVNCAKSHEGWLMGFNEPDQPEPYGNNIPPAEAAELWHQIEQKAGSVKLLSPAPSQMNLDWLWQMVDEYQRKYNHKPRFDAIGAHFYNFEHPKTVQPAKDYLLRVRHEALDHGYDVPIWLTEFAGYASLPDPNGGHAKLMNELIPWMKQQSWITRYAWFASLVREWEPWCTDCQYCSLTNPDGSLTDIGELYTR